MNDRIFAELKQILSAEAFQKSQRVSDVFSHIVKTYLAGNAESLTGITIAQDVFGKDESFNPSRDPVVRVTVARLRRMLKEYYSKEGANSTLKISIPKGGYVPSIEEIKNDLKPTQRITRQKTIFTLLVVILLVGAFSLMRYWDGGANNTVLEVSKSDETISNIDRIERYPTVAILPFENQTVIPKLDNLEKGIQRQIASDLYPFRVIRVVQIDKQIEDLRVEDNLDIDFVVKGALRSVEPDINLDIELLDFASGETVLVERVSRQSGSNYFDALSDISSRISGHFAGPEGALVKAQMNQIRRRIEIHKHTIQDLSAFECFSHYREFIVNRSNAGLEASFDCLNKELETYPNDATLISALSRISYIIGFINENPHVVSAESNYAGFKFDNDITTDAARDMAERAVRLEPRNDFALGSLADFQIAEGDLDGAELTLKQAIASNRGNPRHISNYAIVLSFQGEWDRALLMAEEALARNPDPDWHYFLPQYYNALVTRDSEAAEIYFPLFTKKVGIYMTNMYAFMMAVLTDNQNLIEEKRSIIQDYVDANEEDPLRVVKLSGGSDEVFSAMEDILREGGITLSGSSVPEKYGSE